MILLAGPIIDDTPNVNNIAVVGGSSHVTAVESPQGFVVGTKFSDWVAHGFPYVDEESKVPMPIAATVKAEQ